MRAVGTEQARAVIAQYRALAESSRSQAEELRKFASEAEESDLRQMYEQLAENQLETAAAIDRECDEAEAKLLSY